MLIGDYQNFYLKGGTFSAHNTIEGIIALEKEALAKGFKGLRGTGDGSWALDKDWLMFLVYEKELNRILESHKIRALCSYSIAGLKLEEIYNIGVNHQSSLVKQIETWNRLVPARFTQANS